MASEQLSSSVGGQSMVKSFEAYSPVLKHFDSESFGSGSPTLLSVSLGDNNEDVLSSSSSRSGAEGEGKPPPPRKQGAPSGNNNHGKASPVKRIPAKPSAPKPAGQKPPPPGPRKKDAPAKPSGLLKILVGYFHGVTLRIVLPRLSGGITIIVYFTSIFILISYH